MNHINLYLYSPHQVSASYTFLRIDTSVNADADADVGQGLTLKSMLTYCPSLSSTDQFYHCHKFNI